MKFIGYETIGYVDWDKFREELRAQGLKGINITCGVRFAIIRAFNDGRSWAIKSRREKDIFLLKLLDFAEERGLRHSGKSAGSLQHGILFRLPKLKKVEVFETPEGVRHRRLHRPEDITRE